MRYHSTRASAPTFTDILLEGLAPDGGLYMPESYPKLDLAALRGKTYVDVAEFVFGEFAPEIPLSVLREILEKTYTTEIFGSSKITPIQMLSPGLGLLKLSNGPTLAFKDVPLQLLGNLMEWVLAQAGKEINILGATSGDTGSAAEYALMGKKGIKLFMLSPYGRMSRFQQLQMYTINDPHIFNLVVDGTFDDCQSVVKEVNADADFKSKYKIGAINSINWARIAAQVVYYIYGYLQATHSNDERVTFAVPSGNFGNAFSAFVARQMGLPIDIIVATNENDVLDEFFRTGIYRVRKGKDVKVTSSPSMDIASASNFERPVYELVWQLWPGMVRSLWRELAEKGNFDGSFMFAGLKTGIRSGCASESDVLETIRKIADLGTIIDPHTAVGMHVGLKLRKSGQKLIVAETAQPAKFADTIREAIGYEPPIPRGFEELSKLPEYTTRIEANAGVVKQFIAIRA